MPGHYVRITPLLLTAQRRDKVASMKWDDVGIDGTWHMANGSKREKGTAGDLTLPDFAIDIIRSRSSLASNPYVFASTRVRVMLWTTTEPRWRSTS